MKTTRIASKGRLREGQSSSMRARKGLNKIQEISDEQYAEYNKWFEPMVRESKRKYESVMRRIRSIKESSQWNRETNPYARAAFDAVFNLLDSSYIDLDDAEDDMMEEEYRAENNEMFQMVLQGIYHALEQFIPQVNEIFGPNGLDIIFNDELYDLSI